VSRVSAPLRKRAKRWLAYQLGRLALGALGLLPTPLALALGAALGRAAAAIARTSRARAEAQLAASLGGAVDAPALTRVMFARLGRLVAELALLSARPSRVAAWMAWPAPEHDALRAARAEGRGVLALSAHLGNWELLAARAVAAGHPVSAFARENANVYFDRWIVALRARLGVATLHRGDDRSGRRALEALRRGEVLALLVDQDVRTPSVMAPFFGRPARTARGALELAVRRGVPVVLVLAEGEGAARTARVERVPAPPWRRGEPLAPAVRALAADVNLRLERAIRADPAAWPWLHARWRAPRAGDWGDDLGAPDDTSDDAAGREVGAEA
jgi:KDO2-lipid IV(A) lauroyltransferase